MIDTNIQAGGQLDKFQSGEVPVASIAPIMSSFFRQTVRAQAYVHTLFLMFTMQVLLCVPNTL